MYRMPYLDLKWIKSVDPTPSHYKQLPRPLDVKLEGRTRDGGGSRVEYHLSFLWGIKTVILIYHIIYFGPVEVILRYVPPPPHLPFQLGG